jgi:hypothetical protein
MVKLKSLLGIVLTLCFLSNINAQSNAGNCVINKVFYYPSRYIFSYECYAPSPDDPTFPISGSSPGEYNEVDLSPNFYTTVPTSNICLFTNITLLDMSYNKITSITGLFQTLKCLSGLRIINLANNFIQTALVSTDFDDVLSAQLESIDLSNNKIPSIDTGVFIRSDGSNRFRNLNYLSLKNNLIKEFDILWPLTIPSSSFNLDLSSNPIDTLINKLNRKYSDNVFAYPAIGNRVINIKDNQLQTLSDSNFIQYGLQNSNDLSLFLNKISNYDLRQSSNIPYFICNCPSNGLQLVTWYRQLLAASSINTGALINQLYCSNVANTYPLNINCPVRIIWKYYLSL